jgi:hypothetical protein
LDGIGGAGFRASRLHASLKAVVAKGAFLRRSGDRIDVNDAEGTRSDAVAAAVAGIRLNDHCVEFGSDDCIGWAYLKTSGLHTVLANVAHQQPAPFTAIFGELLNKSDVAPVDAVEAPRIIVTVAAERIQAAIGSGELVPLFASDFARFAADTNGCVGVKPHWLGHNPS